MVNNAKIAKNNTFFALHKKKWIMVDEKIQNDKKERDRGEPHAGKREPLLYFLPYFHDTILSEDQR